MTNTDFPFGVMSMSPASAQEKKKKMDKVNVTNPRIIIGSGFWEHWNLLYYYFYYCLFLKFLMIRFTFFIF